MNETPKEMIYDEQISPKVREIIELCREHKIGMVASFDLGMQPGTENTDDPIHVGASTLLGKWLTPGGIAYEMAVLLQGTMNSGKLEHLTDRDRPGYME